MENNGGGAPAATGCYKCGRPGHWSRDCPFSKPDTDLNNNSNPNPKPNFSRSFFKTNGGPPKPPLEKPKKLPRTIPKLTPELLLSEDGLGFVLRHFTRSFKYRGRGHEVSDLGNLIELYSQWYSHLLPYYSFEQFVHKVEQVGATKRVRTCIRELRDRVANGGDPSKLHEPPVQHDVPNSEPVVEEVKNMEDPSSDKGDPPMESHDVDVTEEEMSNEIFTKAIQEPCQSSQNQMASVQVLSDHNTVEGFAEQVPDIGTSIMSEMQITQDQKARMEASRLKALERASARARSLTAE